MNTHKVRLSWVLTIGLPMLLFLLFHLWVAVNGFGRSDQGQSSYLVNELAIPEVETSSHTVLGKSAVPDNL